MASDPVGTGSIEEDAEPPLRRGRRGASRARAHVNATLSTTSATTTVRLRNISETGAMVEGDRLPWPGRTVLLTRGSLEQMAEVVWSASGKAGLRFLEPIGTDEVIAQSRSDYEPSRPAVVPYCWLSEVPERISGGDWEANRRMAGLRSKH